MKNKTLILGLILLLSCGLVTGVYGATVIVQDRTISQPGATTSVQIVLDQAPAGLYGFVVDCSIADPAVAEITGFQYGPSWSFTLPFERKADGSVIAAGIDMSKSKVPPGSSNVLLATLTVKGKVAGTTTVHANPGLFEGVDNSFMTPDEDPGSLNVNAGSQTQYTITVTQVAHGTISPGTVTKNAGES
jgi:hypothetical protein